MLADIALIATAVGVLAAVFGLRQSNRERLRQFEAMYGKHSAHSRVVTGSAVAISGYGENAPGFEMSDRALDWGA